MNTHCHPETDQILARITARGLMPAVGVYTPDDAVEVARAMLAGGLDVMEITFRKPGAERSITAIREALPEMLVGAGTLLSAPQVQTAINAGAQFGVTPGFNPAVVGYAVECGFPFFPGIATAGEVEQAHSLGICAVKVFPIEQLGGPGYLKALAGPYQQTGMKLIPMGGVKPENIISYLSEPMVGAVGGSWMVPADVIARHDWNSITRLSADAVRLASEARFS